MKSNRSRPSHIQFSLTTLFVWTFWIAGGLTILRAAQSDAVGSGGRIFCGAVFVVWAGAALGDLRGKPEYGAFVGAILAASYALMCSF